MLGVLEQLAAWHAAGTDCAIATIVTSTGSIPRPVGTAMAISGQGTVVGSISGGCVESELVHLAAEVMDTRIPTIRHFAVSDDDAGVIGLMCGGSMEVLVQAAGPAELPGLGLISTVAANDPVAIATIISEGPHLGRSMIVTDSSWTGTLGNADLDTSAVTQTRRHLGTGNPATVSMGVTGDCAENDLTLLLSSTASQPQMLVFGAIDFAHALVRSAKLLGYSVTLCDARPVFATKERFPDADEVVVMWPHAYLEAATITSSTAICVLTHDPKFDVPALEIALRSEAGYVGAMGSRRTHHDRLERLRAAGVTEAQLGRLSSPIGLDLGAATPAETAVSILAEIISLSRNATGKRLSETRGPIHPPLLAGVVEPGPALVPASQPGGS
ncbi:XdhC/CoxI family protein [Paenarthrobacter nitroguajacolicus]|uniref:XdhC/CoxI family protein n=1 Tax=Paenarthrobacter nitroguajacolicus TaxID=211146 RepID=UPI0034485304